MPAFFRFDFYTYFFVQIDKTVKYNGVPFSHLNLYMYKFNFFLSHIVINSYLFPC